MLEFNISVSGSEVAQVIKNDPEELSYFLKELILSNAEGLAEEVTDYLKKEDIQAIKAHLTAFAAALGYSS
jgi:hypothetical protein